MYAHAPPFPSSSYSFLPYPNQIYSNPPPVPFNPNFQTQVPNFQSENFNPNFQNHVPNFQSENFNLSEIVDRAVAKAHCDLLAAKQSVSAWKVSQAALSLLGADSWEPLGCQVQQIPSLARLLITERKINAFIHCYVGARRITTLYDLGLAICHSEGVEQFEEFEMGPLLTHPLIVHYFPMSSDITEVFRITTEDMISYLCEFIDTYTTKEVMVDDLLDFVAKKHFLKGREQLCVRIQNLEMYVDRIRQAKGLEKHVWKKSLGDLKVKSRKLEALKEKSTKNISSHEKQKKSLGDLKVKSRELKGLKEKSIKKISSHETQKKSLRDLKVKSRKLDGLKEKSRKKISSHEKQLDDCSKDTSQPIKAFPSASKTFAGKHIRFMSSGSEDDDGKINGRDENSKRSSSKTLLNRSSSHHVDCCAISRAADDLMLSSLNGVANCNLSADNGDRFNNESSKRKRKYGYINCTVVKQHKLLNEENREIDNSISKRKELRDLVRDDLLLDNNTISLFITTWKEAFCKSNMVEVLEEMLQFYNIRKKKKVRALFSSYPLVGLLNVVVASVKRGMWDKYDTFQISDGGFVNTSGTAGEAVNQEADQQALVTGRLGEFVASKYFAGKFGQPFVKWVNETDESRLPYDIVIGGEEYIEVKATTSTRKDFFEISVREWQFAVEKGESFSIAHVLLGHDLARITVYKNPVRLSMQGELQLAVMLPKQEISPAS